MGLNFLLEYRLEYDTPLDHLFAFDLTASLIGSELPIAAGGGRQKSTRSGPSASILWCVSECSDEPRSRPSGEEAKLDLALHPTRGYIP